MKNLLNISIAVLISYLLVIASFNGFSVGSTLTTLSSSDQLSDFPTTYNANLSEINSTKLEISDWLATTSAPHLTTLANVDTVGTIGTGVWEGTTIDELYGGTGFSTYAKGDILYASAINVISKLTASSTGEVLTLSSDGVPIWQDSTINQTANFTWTGIHTFNTSTTTMNATTTISASSNNPLLLNGIDYTFPSTEGASSTVITTNGSGTLIWDDVPLKYASSSDNVKLSMDTEENIANGSDYTLVKSARVAYSGTLRTKFDIKRSGSNITAYGQIYINGVAVGTLQTTTSSTYVTFTEDFEVTAGDRYDLYVRAWNFGGESMYVRNFRIYYDVNTLRSEVISD